MKHVKTFRLLWILMPILVALLLRAGAADAVLASSSSASWKIVSSPNGDDNTINTLKGVGAVSATDAWAVGSYYAANRGTDIALIEHWDGTAWTVVPGSPAPYSSDNYLNGVKVIAANDAWAVGYYNNDDRTLSQTLILHWDGTSWSVVSSPNKGDGSNKLMAVSGSAGNDVWAVGNFYNTNSGTYQTLTEHYDGTAWSIIYSPLAPDSSDNFLNAVTSIGKNYAWAVGTYFGVDQKTSKTLILRWDGKQWNVVNSPNKGTRNNQLLSVTSASGKDVGAAGFYLNSKGTVVRTLTEHWNGTKWSIVPSANSSSSINWLIGVDAFSSKNVWAVGFAFNSSQVRQTLIEHWNGSSWQVISSPNGGNGDNVLNAITKIPGTKKAWAVGYYIGVPFGPQLTLIEHYA
ncbi:MAG TPA: hypothetical protein VJ761_21075 [Ktedonobacteraceae bacterium]|nr:hypothetical protein [Ktedonobacteraceae bacterium]